MLTSAVRLLFSFKGRSPRVTVWLYGLYANAVLETVKMAVAAHERDPAVFDVPPAVATGLDMAGAALLVLLFLSLADLASRRLHDMNRPIWPALVAVFLLGWLSLPPLAFLALGLVPGTAGPNRFGPDPREHEGVGAWARTRWPS